MSVDFTVDADGWVPAALKLPSPNFEARPDGARPTLVVVHNISLPPGEFGGTAITELFQNRLDCDAHPYYDSHLRGVKVSAHFVIRRDGALEQYVSCDARAWHAGASNFFGRERCNDFSIGIELEGSDAAAFEPAQYETLGALVKTLAAHYPVEALAGHADIAPGRKTDPGPHFEWQRLQHDSALPARYFPYLPLAAAS
ncbi:1,6-anhydro-N-acetylmuramyl-L-alanine amidase AmpD [Paraburkholderia saeva]|uniref:1,6-anhydro-N-acetylmuramyl-L-alanine amidase AmpD n=1 Tax=Paraburkholderia saeva TaxID=2777537 RepID=A0A9N8RSA4_9BURK|nr:1,6-anhydro-N-acetylmuramyl-L-alanine amidase AmpD [Paraburkholderia saeva]CAG4885721.1 1,6-anhydro-N-acetylmuramyl-L-alanine amidase AmpD [Paraburkholderia saeva]CAG4887772.1 1,6-anhydro-N-acetylmuramyl-L-alanine amidase AmpD [Paraburkholderia saeva]CAG4916221.1 1,6-anhydro-N-acetylmuramyl-L-alanine amidase AmpD [Paraburkholderia saeva]